MEHIVSGVGVLDKSCWLLAAAAEGPCTLAELAERTGTSRATAHRLAGPDDLICATGSFYLAAELRRVLLGGST